MLVLTRKLNQSIVVDGNIVVTVVEVRGNRVKLGIEAPADVEVLRQEIWVEVKEQREAREAAR